MLYAINYSYHLHRVFSIVTGRIDKTLTFLLLIFGSSVMASVGSVTIVGFCVTIIAALQNTFTFSTVSEKSRSQAHRYLNLLTISESLSHEDLSSRFIILQQDDSIVWTLLGNIAEYRYELELKGSSSTKLSTFERFINFFI